MIKKWRVSLCFAFILGNFPLLWLASLSFYHLFCLSSFIFVLTLLVCRYSLFFLSPIKLKTPLFIYHLLLLVLTFSFSGLVATNRSHTYLQNIKPYIDKNIIVEARIQSLDFSDYFNLSQKNQMTTIEVYKIKHIALKKPLIMHVFWNDKTPTFIGQSWLFKIKTKVVHALLNEGGFDTQRFYLSRQELLTGTIKEAQLLHSTYSLRQAIATPFLYFLNLSDYPDLILALGFGDRSLLTKAHKTLLFETGVIHLLAISGMHIILVFFLIFTLITFLQKQLKIRFCLYWLPILIAFFVAIFYGWLTGLSPPTQRALLALTFWLLFKAFHISCSNWHKLLYIVFLLLFLDPLMILSESFWLSCYAVFCLLFIAHIFPVSFRSTSKIARYLLNLLFLQVTLTFLLLPIQIFLFQGFSLASIPANLIAIPIISCFVFPLILILLVTSQLSCLYYLTLLILLFIDQGLHLLFKLLHYLSSYWIDVPATFMLCSFLGWVILLFYRFNLFHHYWLFFLGFVLIGILPFFKQPKYSWRLDQIDIGHGLAIVISKNGKALLYDVGASTETGSKAERTLIPFLKQHQLKIEQIIISHQHDDHVGGLASVQKIAPNAKLMSSSSSLNNDTDCVAGSILNWQGLKITVLSPTQLTELPQNPDSCVIQIDDGHYKILLTGDLEAKQEFALVQHSKALLKADILQVPHHGSKTSSTYTFLTQVKPKIALISTARYNPWHLPAKSRLERYNELNIPYFNSAQSGQISILFSPQNYEVLEYRSKIKPRWYHDWFG